MALIRLYDKDMNLLSEFVHDHVHEEDGSADD